MESEWAMGSSFGRQIFLAWGEPPTPISVLFVPLVGEVQTRSRIHERTVSLKILGGGGVIFNVVLIYLRSEDAQKYFMLPS